ncbi:MAG: hypothetical protein ACK40G_00670 [Cytophagaceae bacterium]
MKSFLRLIYLSILSFSIAAVLVSFSAKAQVYYTPLNGQSYTNAAINLDMDMDGNTDITINQIAMIDMVNNTTITNVSVTTGASTQLAGSASMPSALDIDDDIKSKQFYSHNNTSIASYQTYTEWRNTNDKYLGFSISIQSQIYYGWIQLQVSEMAASFSITGFAYQKTSGQTIKAGEPELLLPVQNLSVTSSASIINDINVAFDKISEENKILDYRIFIVPAEIYDSQSMGITFFQSNSNCKSISPTGTNKSFNLSSGDKDINGNNLESAKDYLIIVLANRKNMWVVSSLTVSPNPFMIDGVTGFKSKVSEVVIYSNNNSIFIQNLQSEGYLQIVSLTGQILYNNSVSVGSSILEAPESCFGKVYVKIISGDKVIAKSVFLSGR